MSLQLITTVRDCETKAVCVVEARERLSKAKRVGLYVVVRKLSTQDNTTVVGGQPVMYLVVEDVGGWSE